MFVDFISTFDRLFYNQTGGPLRRKPFHTCVGKRTWLTQHTFKNLANDDLFMGIHIGSLTSSRVVRQNMES